MMIFDQVGDTAAFPSFVASETQNFDVTDLQLAAITASYVFASSSAGMQLSSSTFKLYQHKEMITLSHG